MISKNAVGQTGVLNLTLILCQFKVEQFEVVFWHHNMNCCTCSESLGQTLKLVLVNLYELHLMESAKRHLFITTIIYTNISNSLIIHEGNTKKINTETEFGYVMKHLHKIKPTFISIFSLNTDLFEMLYQTLRSWVFHQVIQTPWSC